MFYFPSLFVFALVGGVFLSSGIGALKEPPRPYRALDAAFQISLGLVCCVIAGAMALALFIRPHH